MKTTITYHKRTAGGLLQLLTGIIILYCYYQGLHKYISFADYSFWLVHTPFIQKQSQLFAYGVPAYYLAIALLLATPKTSTAALWMLLAGETVFVGWVLYMRTYTPHLFWPWHVFWGGKLNWFYKFLEALTVAWLAALLLFLQRRGRQKT